MRKEALSVIILRRAAMDAILAALDATEGMVGTLARMR